MNFTKAQEKEISETLKSFGFNKKDQDVYLGLLEYGVATLTPLSRKVGFPSTTVQSSLARLQSKGVVGVTKRKSRSVYEALDPIIFKDLLKEQATAIAGIVPLLQSAHAQSTVQSNIRVFERDRVTQVLNESLKCKDKVVLEIVSAGPFQKVIGEKYHYSRRRVKAGVHLKSLRVRSTEVKKYTKRAHEKELREARFLPNELSFKSSIMLWDNTVALLSTKSESAHVMITSESIANMYRQLFTLLWSVSGTMETASENM